MKDEQFPSIPAILSLYSAELVPSILLEMSVGGLLIEGEWRERLQVLAAKIAESFCRDLDALSAGTPPA
jgi:hypothetical protein